MHITPPPGGGVVRIPDVENVPAGRLSSMSGNQVVNPSDGHIFKFRYRSLRVPAAGIHRYGTDIRCPASAAAGDVPARVGDTPAPAAGGGGGEAWRVPSCRRRRPRRADRVCHRTEKVDGYAHRPVRSRHCRHVPQAGLQDDGTPVHIWSRSGSQLVNFSHIEPFFFKV